eukprot:1162018-Pelagomonas_calceolata.AAC.3
MVQGLSMHVSPQHVTNSQKVPIQDLQQLCKQGLEQKFADALHLHRQRQDDMAKAKIIDKKGDVGRRFVIVMPLLPHQFFGQDCLSCRSSIPSLRDPSPSGQFKVALRHLDPSSDLP